MSDKIDRDVEVIAAFMAGMDAERGRIREILALPEARGQERAAIALALADGEPVLTEKAREILAVAATTSAILAGQDCILH